jgi:hypothetical protein
LQQQGGRRKGEGVTGRAGEWSLPAVRRTQARRCEVPGRAARPPGTCAPEHSGAPAALARPRVAGVTGVRRELQVRDSQLRLLHALEEAEHEVHVRAPCARSSPRRQPPKRGTDAHPPMGAGGCALARSLPRVAAQEPLAHLRRHILHRVPALLPIVATEGSPHSQQVSSPGAAAGGRPRGDG